MSTNEYRPQYETLRSVFALGITFFIFRPGNGVRLVFPVAQALLPAVGNLRELISVFALGIAIFTFLPTNGVLFVFLVTHRLVPGVGNSSRTHFSVFDFDWK